MFVKTLKFAPHLVPLVLSGEKTATWRLFDEKDLQEGDILDLLEQSNGNTFAQAVIVSVKEKQLQDLRDDDYVGHEKFESQEKMYETYRGYYGDRVTPETLVKIIRFEIIASNKA